MSGDDRLELMRNMPGGWFGGWSTRLFRRGGPLVVGSEPDASLNVYVAVRFSSPPEEVDSLGIRSDQEWARLMEAMVSLRAATSPRQLQWVAAAAGEGKSTFIFYADDQAIVETWRHHLAAQWSDRQPELSDQLDPVHTWYKILRDEAIQAKSDSEVITEWRRQGGRQGSRVPVDFVLLFDAEEPAARARTYTENQWDGATTRISAGRHGPDWILSITADTLVTSQLIAPLRRRAEVIAHKFGGRFDGWGAALSAE